MTLALRSNRAELMDDADLDPAIYQRCLADLAAVNRVTFTHAATLRWLSRAVRGVSPGTAISILDVAYGQGDLLRAIASWAGKRGVPVVLSGIDLNPRSARAAQAATPPGTIIAYHTGDVFAYRPQTPVDIIVSSQFTHHLANEQIVALLRWLEAQARLGWAISDLQRHALPYYGFRLLARLMGWHEIVRKDGTVSIARGFRRADWQALLAQAGIKADIAWQLPFRFGVSRIK